MGGHLREAAARPGQEVWGVETQSAGKWLSAIIFITGAGSGGTGSAAHQAPVSKPARLHGSPPISRERFISEA